MIGVIVGAVSVISFLNIIVNAYITSRRLANVLSDVEELIHSDFKELETKVEAALNKARITEVKSQRD
jgi:T4 RNA ligase 2 C-terminal